jgi:hypothetical protein
MSLQGTALALAVAATLIVSYALVTRIVRRRRMRQWRREHPQSMYSTSYAVESPEYNAQIVGVIRELNRRLIGQGKRIPEKIAIEIIHLTGEDDEQEGDEQESDESGL